MKTYEVSVRIPLPADEALRLVTTTEYAEWEALNEGAITAKARIENASDTALTMIIDRTDHSRGPGGVKISKKERNIITQQWDLKAMKNTWSVRVPGMEKLVSISGVMQVAPDGGGACVLREKGGVSIKVPLLGGVVEKSIAADIVRDFPKKTEFFNKKRGS